MEVLKSLRAWDGMPREVVRGSSAGFDHESAYTTRSLAFFYFYSQALGASGTPRTW
jgi:hypothetical protein